MLNHPLAARLLQILPALTIPGICLWALSGLPALTPVWQSLLVDVLPGATLICALLLSIRFNRSRFSFLLLFIAIGWASQTGLRGQLLPATESLLFAALLLNGLLFSLFKDRSLFSIHGFWRLALIGGQSVVLYFLVTEAPAIPLALLQQEWFTLPESLALFIQLPDAVVLIALIICLLHMSLSVIGNRPMQATFFGCQLGLLGIASGYPDPAFVPMLVSSCGFLIVLAIIMDSHNMAYRDELTGLPSRRALNQRLLGLGRRYCIAMLDIDHFKSFNDTHGHDIGDEVLRMVASKIRQVTGGGKAYRYGGEEFTIVFPSKSPEQAMPHLEALRAAIENYRMIVRQQAKRASNGKRGRGRKSEQHKSLQVTISIGYAAREAEQKFPEAVIKAADKALYRAKQKGRNCLSV